MGENGHEEESLYGILGKACKLVFSPWTSEWSFFKNPEMELPSDSALPLRGI